MKALRIITVTLFILSALLYCGITAYYHVALDRVSPVIQCQEGVLDVRVSDGEDVLLAGVTATDNRDGNLTGQIMVQGVSRLLSANTARVTYVVFDSSKNMGSLTRTIRYTDYERPVIELKQPPVFAPYPDGNAYTDLRDALTARDVRDGDISDLVHIAAQNVNSTVEGTYHVNVQITNSLGDAESIPLTIVVDAQGAENPLVTLREYITYLQVGDPFDPHSLISTVNGVRYTGDDSDLAIDSNVDTSTAGYYEVCYRSIANGQEYSVYLAVVVR